MCKITHEQSLLRHSVQSNSAGFLSLADGDAEQTIPAYFGLKVAQYPDRLAVKGRTHSFTFAQVDRFSNAIGATLIKRGHANSFVILFMDHDAQMVATILGILKASSAYIPLDPTLTGTRNLTIVEDSLASLVLTDSQNHAVAKDLFASSCEVWNIDEIDVGRDPCSSFIVRPDDVACIIYTSGSTGRPRGVLQTHSNIVQIAKRYVNSLAMSCEDQVSLLVSWVRLLPHWALLFGSLLTGATLLPLNVREVSPPEFAKWLCEERVSIYRSSPSLFRTMFRICRQIWFYRISELSELVGTLRTKVISIFSSAGRQATQQWSMVMVVPKLVQLAVFT